MKADLIAAQISDTEHSLRAVGDEALEQFERLAQGAVCVVEPLAGFGRCALFLRVSLSGVPRQDHALDCDQRALRLKSRRTSR